MKAGKRFHILALAVAFMATFSSALPSGVQAQTLPPGTQAKPVAPASKPQPVAPVVQPAGKYSGLMIAELTRTAPVLSAPGGKRVKSWWAGRRVLLYQKVADAKGGQWYRVSEAPEASMYVSASSIRMVAPVKFEGGLYTGKWVNVNVSQQVVTAYEYGVPVLVTLASTGTAKNPTNLGVQRLLWRFPSREMIGGSKETGDYYDLKNVPWPQYFNNTGEALHGTYWHDDFGRPHSHGCVNLSTPIAGWFYGWANLGTVVYVHN